MTLFKILLMSIFMTVSGYSFAAAQTPPEVLEPYKQYRAAVEAKDLSAARKHALKAWEQAEAHLGDSKTTGDLAQNYADLKKDGKDKKTEEAYERAIELARFYKEEAAEIWIDRNIRLATYYRGINKTGKAGKILKTAYEFAETNGFGTTTYAGEIRTLQAEMAVMRGKHKETERLAEEAMDIFETRDDNIVSALPVLATLYSGYGKEGQDDLVPAVMEYQKIMEATDSASLPRTHPLRMRALGRWMTMRNRINREGLMDEANAAGLCACWPYDKKRNEEVQPIKRVPPEMPSRAWQSGFSIVEFDLDDEGNVVNPKILESWPAEIWDKSSLKAVKKWKYSPRTPDQTDGDRSEIVTTITYRLTDEFGNVIE